MKNANKIMSLYLSVTRFGAVRLRSTSFAALIAVFALMFALAVPQDGFAKTTKKKKITVNVEEDANCPSGVSLSDESWGSSLVCTQNNPTGAADTLRNFVGQRIEVEAQFLYTGDPKNTPPDQVNKLIRIAGHKVYNPCPTSMVILAGFAAGLSNTNPTLPPGCGGDDGASADQSPGDGSDPQ